MSDESAETETSSDQPIGGERLRVARRSNDISVRDIAKELHLDEAKVRSLEANDFDQLGAPVFAKGHLRKYAELVGVPIDDILDDYYQLNRSAGAPPVVGPKRKERRDYSFVPALSAGVLLSLLIATGGYWWFTSEPEPDAAELPDPTSLAPFADETAARDGAEPAPRTAGDRIDPAPPVDIEADEQMPALGAAAQNALDAQTEEEIQIDETQTDSAQPEATPVVEDVVSDLPQVEVTMTFSGDCWTEASDASGRRLFYDLGTPGRVVTISGDAPLRIVVGDSDNVKLQVEGRDFAIPDSARRGRLARLTIDRP